MKLNKDNCYKLKEVETIVEEGDFVVRPIMVVVDEMSEVMEGKNYKAVQDISDAISSIARLGRAASVHLVLAPLPEDLIVEVNRDDKIKLSLVSEYKENLHKKLLGEKYELPPYFDNMPKDFIEEYYTYISELLNDFENSKGEKEVKTEKVKWRDVELGDIIDGGVVVYTGPWVEEQCIRLFASDDTSIEASKTHLFKVHIYSGKDKVNHLYYKSEEIRKALYEENDCWICVEDICSAIDNGNRVELMDGNRLIGFEETEIKEVRCIQTTKGEYNLSMA